jgi:hypothetical protein
MNRSLLLFLLLPISLLSQAQSSGAWPAEVQAVLAKAGDNRQELEKAIHHYQAAGDPQKLKAVYFLIASMDIHFTEDYYWEDRNGKKIAYDELQYPDINAALRAFEDIRKKNPGLHPHPYLLNDAQGVSAEFLIHNVDKAFDEWKHSAVRDISFQDFCEYILPYRISVEPLQDWRKAYEEHYAFANKKVGTEGLPATVSGVVADQKSWFTNTWYSQDTRKDPLPRLGAMQLLFRKKGPCEDIADMEVFALRSQGIPATINIVPYWATSSGSHFLNTAFDGKKNPVHFDASGGAPKVDTRFAREPGKVISITWSRQSGTLASQLDPQHIPPGFLRLANYIDVTSNYWETTDVQCSLFPATSSSSVAFAAVFNGMKWRPVWWGKVRDGAVTFGNMCKGAVFLPMYYSNGHLKPAGYPIAIGYHHQLVLMPDLHDKKTITVTQEEKHLLFRPGRKYQLYYWNNEWRSLGAKVPAPGSSSVQFDNVPAHALLLLLPEYSEGKERPFMILDDGKVQWW